MAPRIATNLFHDWAQYLRSLLAQEGHSVVGSDMDVCVIYYDLERRYPLATPRRIFKPSGFRCPAECEPGLAELERKIEAGEDLRPHLNVTFDKLDARDGMLTDWGILHFHLGTKPHAKRPKFMARTGALLYARLTRDAAYFIGVFGHGEWANEGLIRVLHDNWPASIKEYLLSGVVGMQMQIAPSDRKRLRGAQINSSVELEPGVVYLGPGGGVALSGHSFLGVQKANDAYYQCEAWEKLLRERSELWLPKAKEPNGWFEFKLRIEDGIFYAVDEAQAVAIKLRVSN